MIPRANNVAVGYHTSYWIAVSSNPELNMVQVIKQDGDVLCFDVSGSPSLTVIPLEDVEGKYQFINKHGEIIK